MPKPNKRAATRAVAVAAILTVTLAGCGVPAGGPVNRVEEVPRDARGAGAADDARVMKPTRAADETAENFLRAAAGDWGGRDARLDEFVEGTWRWSEHSAGIQLLRLDDASPSVEVDSTEQATAKVTGELVGVYGQDGQVKPVSGSDEYSATFQLTRESAADTWTIDDPPRQVALLNDEFDRQYQATPLYFHAVDDSRDTLVPDLRWLPAFDPGDERAYTQLADWLVAGPSEWIESTVVNSFPSGVSRKSVTVDEDTVTVDVSSESASTPVDDFKSMSAQLAWSLGLSEDMRLTLQVDGQERLTKPVSNWSARNRAPSDDDDARSLVYYINDGTIRANDPEAPFAGEQPEGLREAVLESGRDRMAAVVAVDGGYGLMHGAPQGQETGLHRVDDFWTAELEDPQWLDRSRLLVLADEKPTVVNVDSGDTTEVSVSSDADSMTAMALAPDGRRVAYVADGRVWMAPLTVSDDKVQIGAARQIGEEIRDVVDVGWSQETRLLMIGDASGTDEWLWEISIDNASQTAVSDALNVPKGESLAVRCNPPARAGTVGQPAVVASRGEIFRVFASESPIELLEFEDADGDVVVAEGAAPFVAN
ncbi:MAG: GerMN domain-containing protein [Stackebrandtia sp.]